MPTDEKEFLDNLFDEYVTAENSSQTKLMRDLVMRTFKPFIAGGRALELGCEVGYLSSLISPLVEHLDIVDGSSKFLQKVKKRNLPNVTCIHSLFEEIKAEPIYDIIFGTFILEHLLDVKTVVKIVRDSLKPGGLFMAVVPNARAASRQLARHMGLINELTDLTPNDIAGGHRRVYDRIALNRDLQIDGLTIIAEGGIFFKPFADFQLSKMIDRGLIGQAQINGLYAMGMEYPDMCSAIYSILKKG